MSNEASTNKQKQRGASRKATQSTGSQHARRKEVRNEHNGTYKQSSTLGQGRICTGLQNALPKAVGGILQGACNWMQRGGQRWAHKPVVVTTYLCSQHSWEPNAGSKTQ